MVRVVPSANQAFGVLEDLRIGRTPPAASLSAARRRSLCVPKT